MTLISAPAGFSGSAPPVAAPFAVVALLLSVRDLPLSFGAVALAGLASALAGLAAVTGFAGLLALVDLEDFAAALGLPEGFADAEACPTFRPDEFGLVFFFGLGLGRFVGFDDLLGDLEAAFLVGLGIPE